ncbi:hypothetical protein V1281_004318 [Nitrobacteraceae bacterium AZCC 2161]
MLLAGWLGELIVLRVGTRDHEHSLKTEPGPGIVSAQVGKLSVQRVVLIVDTIARALERLGHTTADAKDGADLALLWQIYSRSCFFPICLLQYGHR